MSSTKEETKKLTQPLDSTHYSLMPHIEPQLLGIPIPPLYKDTSKIPEGAEELFEDDQVWSQLSIYDRESIFSVLVMRANVEWTKQQERIYEECQRVRETEIRQKEKEEELKEQPQQKKAAKQSDALFNVI